MNTLPADLFSAGWFTTDSEDELEQAKVNYWKQDDSEYEKEHAERYETEDRIDEEEVQTSLQTSSEIWEARHERKNKKWLHKFQGCYSSDSEFNSEDEEEQAKIDYWQPIDFENDRVDSTSKAAAMPCGNSS